MTNQTDKTNAQPVSSNLSLEYLPQVQLIVKQLVAKLSCSNRTTIFFFICDNSYHLKDILGRGKPMELLGEELFALPFRYIRKKVLYYVQQVLVSIFLF